MSRHRAAPAPVVALTDRLAAACAALVAVVLLAGLAAWPLGGWS